MARTKAFDPDDVLERAMQTFWSHGYQATSTQQLERELGINRSSMYATFGSKEALYAEALARYVRRPAAVELAPSEDRTPIRDRIAAMLRADVEADLAAPRCRGCFAVNAAVELGPDDEHVRRLVAAAVDGIGRRIGEALTDARRRGELRADADVEALTSMLVAVIEGLHVLAKGTRDRALIDRAIAGAVAAI